MQPIVEGGEYRFTVVMGQPPFEAQQGTKVNGRGANFRCIISDSVIGGRLHQERSHGRKNGDEADGCCCRGIEEPHLSNSPRSEMEEIAKQVVPSWKPDVEFFQQALGFRVGNYGMKKWSDLFTSRQLVALTTSI